MMLHMYGMRNRGFAPGCQPKGLTYWHDCSDDQPYHSIIGYKTKLLQKEERQYELDYLGKKEVL